VTITTTDPTEIGADILTLGRLKEMLSSLDLPDDTTVLMEGEDMDQPMARSEYPVSRVVASRGFGERSRIVFGY